MGINNQGYALVVMANKDVYYVSIDDAIDLALAMAAKESVFQATDVKSGARLTIQIALISSLVQEDKRDA